MRPAPKATAWLVFLVLGFAACSDADGNVGLRTSDENEQAEIGEVDAPQVIGGDESETPDGDGGGADSDGGSGGDEGSTVEADRSAGSDDGTDTGDGTDPDAGTEPATNNDGTGTGVGGTGSGNSGDGDADAPNQPEGPARPPLDDSEEPEPDPGDDPAAEGRVDVSYPSAPVTNLGSGVEVDLAGELADRDKRTLLWFWQPGSGPSAAEADVVARLEDELGDSIDVVAVGTGGDLESARSFVADAMLNDVTLLWDGSAEAVEYYEVSQLPSSILLDVNGDIIGRWDTLSPEVFQLVRILS